MSTKEEELFDAMARDGMAPAYIKDMIAARRELFGGGGKEGCARCSAEAHAAMTAPEGGSSITDPSKPTKPLQADPSGADLRKRLGLLVERMRNEALIRAGSNGMQTFGEQMAYEAMADMLEKELAK